MRILILALVSMLVFTMAAQAQPCGQQTKQPRFPRLYALLHPAKPTVQEAPVFQGQVMNFTRGIAAQPVATARSFFGFGTCATGNCGK